MPFQSTRLSDSSVDSSSDDECEPRCRRPRIGQTPAYNPKFPVVQRLSETSGIKRRLSEDDKIDKRRKIEDDKTESENSRRESQSTEDSYQPSDDDKANKQVGLKENKAKKMMERMGYREGEGLGKHAQGIVEPVESSKQRGRRGLGLHIKGLEAATMVWDSKLEVIEVEEKVKWLVEANHHPLSQATLTTWLVRGPVKLSLDGETHFCDPDLLRNVLGSKSVFDELEPEEMRKARSRSNPFETIRGGIFLNRAAMKMANMDRVFDFIFSKPVDQMGEPMVNNDELLFFADVCAGPGGFSEYILWRKKWHAKGFGFTLRGDCDFRLQDFHAGPCETFFPHYGKNGPEGNGDVMDPVNISVFTDFVLSQTDGNGVHFAMADGGFSVEGQENIQEILSKQLYLCQFLVGLSIVRTGGTFLCKVFDLFTPFSVGLIYLMYKSFHRVTIHKPNTSRPANSERYLICQWKREDSEVIRNHLYRCNKWAFSNKDKQCDVNELVSLNTLLEDEAFYNYIVESNNSIGECQVVNLVKVAAYCRDSSLHENIQGKMRTQCLEYWEVPDRARTVPPRLTPEMCTESLFEAGESVAFMNIPGGILTPESLPDVFKSVHDWQCVVLGCSEGRDNCTFYLGLGRSRVYRQQREKWVRIEEAIELSPKTLIYGEMVEELRGEGRAQRKIIALHIIDAFYLGGEDVRNLDLTTRLSKAALFCRALDKPGANMISLRTKELFPVPEVHRLFASLKSCQLKKAGGIERMCYDLGHSVFLPGGVMFLKTTKAPYMKSVSRKTHHVYFFHTIKRVSTYEKDIGNAGVNPAVDCFTKRRLWWWNERTLDSLKSDGSLSRFELLRFVDRLLD